MQKLTNSKLKSFMSMNTKSDQVLTDSSGMNVRVYSNGLKTFITFLFRKSINGQKIRETIGKYPFVTIEDARVKYSELLFKYNNGAKQKRDNHTLDEAWAEWRNVADVNSSVNTIKKYTSLYKNHFSKIAGIKVKDVTPKLVMDVILKDYLKQGDYSTADRMASALIACMRTAVFFEWVPYNPIVELKKYVPRPTFNHIQTFDTNNREERLKELASSLQSQSPLIRGLVLFYFYTLLRSSEVRGLTEDRIYQKYFVTKTKTLNEFQVPITKEVQKIINYFKDNKQCSFETKLLFTSKNGMVANNLVNNALIKMGFDDLRVHGIRTIGEEWLRKQDGIKETVAKLCLSHVAGDRTDRAYVRDLFFEERFLAMEKWASYLNSLGFSF